MKYTVAKPFKTPARRFAVGQSVAPTDIDGPVPFGELVKRGFISTPKAAPQPKAAAPTAD